jgi:hypothetical protein
MPMQLHGLMCIAYGADMLLIKKLLVITPHPNTAAKTACSPERKASSPYLIQLQVR